ncbi:MAG: hypothetical protein L6Q99_05540 [Planctomycetes bacterium]|nr:hypothetical protein [Planctomycetota bacterium]
MKASQRLDYNNLAAALGQGNLIDSARLSLAVQTAQQSRTPLPELLVTEGAIGDWELSHVVCEVFGLPFLPVDICPPNPKSLEGLDPEFLRVHRLIPIDRHGQVLTVCMPGLVQADVLGMLAADADVTVLPVVGSVESNNRWLAQNLAREVEAALPAEGQKGEWSNIFDSGDAAVMQGLGPGENPTASFLDELPPLPGSQPNA